MIRTITATGLLAALILLSGCGAILSQTATPEPAIVLLPTVAASATPAPTPTPIPPPATPVSFQPTRAAGSPTPAPATPTSTPAGAGLANPAPATRPASGQAAARVAQTMTGAWDFTFGTMALTQRGARVEGTYAWSGGLDSGRVEGIVVEELNQFQGLWVSDRDPTIQGFLRWELAPDRTSFTGRFEGGSAAGQWCGARTGQPLPDGCGFSGAWLLRFGNPPGVTGQASLVQAGSAVQGSYVDSEGGSGEITNGRLAVTSLSEAKLTGIWRDDRGGEDSFDWRLDLTTGRTFQGRRDPGNSEWCGWRSGVDAPNPCGW